MNKQQEANHSTPMQLLFQHVRFISRVFTLALSLLIGVSVVEAQESGAEGQQQPDSGEPNIEQVDEVLRLWEIRRDLVFAMRADRLLKDLLRKHPDTQLREQIDARLAAVREPLAEHSLELALYYLKRFEEGKAPQAKGAESHLRHIICEYPKFSRMGEVLGHLLRMYNLTGKTEAANFMQQLINELPDERDYQKACEELSRPDFGQPKLRLLQPAAS